MFSGFLVAQQAETDKQGLRQVLTDWSEKTSVQGVSFLTSSSRVLYKSLWAIVLLVATGATIYQFYFVLDKFLQYGATTTVRIQYGSLDFPTVTLCTSTPIRRSEATRLTGEMQDFFEQISDQQEYTTDLRQTPGPTIATSRQPSNTPRQPSSTPRQPSSTPRQPSSTPRQPSSTSEPESERSFETQNSTTTMDELDTNDNETDTQNGTTTMDEMNTDEEENLKRKKRQAPSSNATYVFDDIIDEYGDIGDIGLASFLDDFGYGRISSLRQQNIFFKRRFSFMSDELRRDVGIEASPVVFGCEFNGRDCSSLNFSIFQTLDYGNCLQFNNAINQTRPLKSIKAGSETGLNLQLFIEREQQIQGLADINAAQILINQFNTTALVYQLGMPIGTGSHATISMKRTTVTKLGPPYNKCDDGGEFERIFKQKYTNKACRATCADRLIADECKCLRAETRDLYSEETQHSLSICLSVSELTCTQRIQLDVDRNVRGCNCEQGCSETDYELTVSNSQWPSENSWFTLANRLCEIDEEVCRRIQSIDVTDRLEYLRDNFLSLSIYFGDLGELVIGEQPEYEVPQFMSDLGGTFGLYIGASVLTFGEILSLTYAICKLSKRRDSKQTRTSISTTDTGVSQNNSKSISTYRQTAELSGAKLKNGTIIDDGSYMGLQGFYKP